MNSNEVANILEFYQGKYNVSQSVICDGICAFSTISKPKVEDKDMDYIIVEALLARVGRNVNELEISLDDREYELWDARQIIRSAMWSKDMKKVESELNYYMGEITEGSLVYHMDGGGRYQATLKAGYEDYETWVEAMFDEENYRAVHDITEEKAAEIRQMLENTKTFPVRTEPILTIIQEEAGAYFAGSKSIEEVCALIQNRVQLYLDEKN